MNRMRRGGRRPNPRPYVPQPPPLLTNQLGLQDIDLELELLKRKREIIEQQQQMLNKDCLSGNRFGEFSVMYEDRGSYGPGSSGAKKRPQVWEHDSPPKRFATGNINVPKTFIPQYRAPVRKPTSHAGFQPRSSGFQPRSSGFQPRSGPNPTVAKKKDFKPSKVSKPSPVPPPNKLNSYGQAERRTLVTQTMGPDSLILRSDRPASNQLNGRLELALGHIVKEIRAKFPEYEEQFTNVVGRAIKQSLRDRLRACLLGKPVTLLNDTIKTYRETYPPETDKDLLLNSLEEQTGTDFVPIESDNPQEFFTKNLSRLMTKKLEEMFNKLGEIYSPEIPPEKFTPKKNDKNNSDIKENESKPNNADVQVITEQKENSEVYDITDIDKETTLNTDKEDNDDKYKKIVSTEEYQRLENLMSGMLPYMLKKFVPTILKTMKLDGMYRKTFNGIKQDLKKKVTFVGDKVTTTNKQPDVPKPIQKPVVSHVENVQKEGEKVETPKKFMQPLYFAKIYGRPSLPKRKAMQAFFENYKPKTIKKHRTVHNILFVGFFNKENFDKLLAAHGTVIGRNTLIIKVSERTKPSPDENNDSLDIINEDLDEQITELLSSIKKSEGILEDDEIQSDDTKPEAKDENETIMNDNETNFDPNVETTDKIGEMPENDITDIPVQENGATEETIEEDNKEDPKATTENVAEATDIENSDTNTEKQDEITKTPNTEIENNTPIENKTDEDLQKDKEDVENITEIETEKKHIVNELKSEVKEVKGTPTRSSARLAATPSAIRTRRASKLAENNS